MHGMVTSIQWMFGDLLLSAIFLKISMCFSFYQSLSQFTHSRDFFFWLFQWIDWFSNLVEIETKENLNFHLPRAWKLLLQKEKDCCNITTNLLRAERYSLATKQFVVWENIIEYKVVYKNVQFLHTTPISRSNRHINFMKWLIDKWEVKKKRNHEGRERRKEREGDVEMDCTVFIIKGFIFEYVF